jgi:hypothetical protein
MPRFLLGHPTSTVAGFETSSIAKTKGARIDRAPYEKGDGLLKM